MGFYWLCTIYYGLNSVKYNRIHLCYIVYLGFSWNLQNLFLFFFRYFMKYLFVFMHLYFKKFLNLTST